jgi:hypothetical protein
MSSDQAARLEKQQTLASALGLVAYEARALAATIQEEFPVEGRPWRLASLAKQFPENTASRPVRLVNDFVRLERALHPPGADGISTSITSMRGEYEATPAEWRDGKSYEEGRDARRALLPARWFTGGFACSQDITDALEVVWRSTTTC